MGNLLSQAGGSLKAGFQKGSGGQGVEGLLENPLFNIGMGLLQANNAGPGQNKNPFSAALGGLQQTQQNRDIGDERDALEKARQRQDELYKRLQEVYAPQPGQPQMSSIGQQPNLLQQLGIGGAQPVPGQTPGIVPGAPPVGGNPANPFSSAPTSAGAAPVGAAPPISEIGSIMLQYGSPAQQQAVYSQMSAGDRFKQRLAAEETRYQQGKDNRNRIGQFNPRDYTTESFAEFEQTGNVGALERYERVRTVKGPDGINRRIDVSTGQMLGVVEDVGDVAANKREINRAGAQGTAEGGAITAAQQQLAGLQTNEDQLTTLMADKNFGASVGKLDAVTGRFGEMFGSEQGVLGGEVQRVSNALVTQAVSSWKGAISERELQFFQDSVPGRGSSEATWRHWFENEYKPRKRLAERVASGEVFHDDRLQGGSSSTAQFDNFVSQEAADLLSKYLTPQQAAQ